RSSPCSTRLLLPIKLPATCRTLRKKLRCERMSDAVGGRNEFPADLPRKRVEYRLPPEQLACPGCGQERKKFGEEVSEQLEFIPASLLVIEHVRFKYACQHCQEQVAVAPKPPQPI